MRIAFSTAAPFFQAVQATGALKKKPIFSNLYFEAWHTTRDYLRIQAAGDNHVSLISTNRGYNFCRVTVPCRHQRADEARLIPFVPLWRLMKGGTVNAKTHVTDNNEMCITGDELLPFKGISQNIREINCPLCNGQGYRAKNTWSPPEVCMSCEGSGLKTILEIYWNGKRLTDLPRARACKHNKIAIPGVQKMDTETPLVIQFGKEKHLLQKGDTFKEDVVRCAFGAFTCQFPTKPDEDRFPQLPDAFAETHIKDDDIPEEVVPLGQPDEREIHIATYVKKHGGDLEMFAKRLFNNKNAPHGLLSQGDGFLRIRQFNVELMQRFC